MLVKSLLKSSSSVEKGASRALDFRDLDPGKAAQRDQKAAVVGIGGRGDLARSDRLRNLREQRTSVLQGTKGNANRELQSAKGPRSILTRAVEESGWDFRGKS